MRRRPCTLIALSFAGFLGLMAAPPALALNHVSALRSGEVIVGPVVVLAPAVRRDGEVRSHMALIPVLMGNPHSPAEVSVYKNAVGQLRTPMNSGLLKGYENLISSLPMETDIFAGTKRGISGVSWIRSDKDVSLYTKSRRLSVHAMKRITSSFGKDATVFVKPIVVFSRDCAHVYLIERLAVFAWGPVHSFYLGSRVLHSGFWLLNTKPELKAGGVQGLAASQETGGDAVRARIDVWFANHGRRLMQAIKATSRNLTPALSSYLQGG